MIDDWELVFGYAMKNHGHGKLLFVDHCYCWLLLSSLILVDQASCNLDPLSFSERTSPKALLWSPCVLCGPIGATPVGCTCGRHASEGQSWVACTMISLDNKIAPTFQDAAIV